MQYKDDFYKAQENFLDTKVQIAKMGAEQEAKLEAMREKWAKQVEEEKGWSIARKVVALLKEEGLCNTQTEEKYTERVLRVCSECGEKVYGLICPCVQNRKIFVP